MKDDKFEWLAEELTKLTDDYYSPEEVRDMRLEVLLEELKYAGYGIRVVSRLEERVL